MPARNYAFGTLEPVTYFINSSGAIALPPSTRYALACKDRMRARGFELKEAATLPEIDALQKHMVRQEYAQQQRQLEHEEALGARIRGSVRDRLYSRMTSSGCSEYEKEYIRVYLQTREEKRHKHQQRFAADQMYFESREFDASSHHIQEVVDRTPNQEDVECKRCRKNQRARGYQICLKCANELAGQAGQLGQAGQVRA